MLKIIKDAQLLLNMHRVCHSILQHHYFHLEHVASTQKHGFQRQSFMVRHYHQALEGHLEQSVSLYKQAAHFVEACFRDPINQQGSESSKGVGHLKGLTVVLSDYASVLTDQRKVYTALEEHLSEMNYWLDIMLIDCGVKENPLCASTIHHFREHLTETRVFLERISEVLKRLEHECLSLSKKKDQSYVDAIALMKHAGLSTGYGTVDLDGPKRSPNI